MAEQGSVIALNELYPEVFVDLDYKSARDVVHQAMHFAGDPSVTKAELIAARLTSTNLIFDEDACGGLVFDWATVLALSSFAGEALLDALIAGEVGANG